MYYRDYSVNKFAKGGIMDYDEDVYDDDYDRNYGSESIYEIHYKPNYNETKPYMVWDKLEGKNVFEFSTREDAMNWIKKSEYGKGGMMKFSDKVNAISERLEGKKVPAKYQNEYGKTFDKKESIDSARRIVGAMENKMAKGGEMEHTDNEHPFKVGDILYDSWGYEQTNIDFYQVVDVKDKTIKITPIEKKSENAKDPHTAYVQPVKNAFKGKPITKKILYNKYSKYHIKSKYGTFEKYKDNEKIFSSSYA